ncbi:hypothetical protein EYF80_041253 [Liparis tanakae]|uniref:Uncharacterized protein n=1 Tax=Liparis tanakae TaxID=230148 RepID=A0A4Z2G4Q6_9TELE|nr:hypothetical protein EYF80_041253 [Liparis tanakae]
MSGAERACMCLAMQEERGGEEARWRGSEVARKRGGEEAPALTLTDRSARRFCSSQHCGARRCNALEKGIFLERSQHHRPVASK